MARIQVNKDRCKGCALCVSVCRNKLIMKAKRLNKRGLRAVEFRDAGKRCTGCAMCAVICPEVCIEVYK